MPGGWGAACEGRGRCPKGQDGGLISCKGRTPMTSTNVKTILLSNNFRASEIDGAVLRSGLFLFNSTDYNCGLRCVFVGFMGYWKGLRGVE